MIAKQLRRRGGAGAADAVHGEALSFVEVVQTGGGGVRRVGAAGSLCRHGPHHGRDPDLVDAAAQGVADG